MFVLWAILLMAPQKEDGRPEAHNLWPYNSDAETTFLSSPHLSSHYPADRVTGTISNRYSSRAPFFFFFPSPTICFLFVKSSSLSTPQQTCSNQRVCSFYIYCLFSEWRYWARVFPRHPLCTLLFETAKKWEHRLRFCCWGGLWV